MPSARTEAVATVMRLMNGAWIARIVHTAAEIGIADHLDDKPRDAQWLATASGTHAASLARLLPRLGGHWDRARERAPAIYADPFGRDAAR